MTFTAIRQFKFLEIFIISRDSNPPVSV